MSTVTARGRIWVGAGFALALAFILAALWWTTRPKVLTTADAVWFLPPAGIFHSAGDETAVEPGPAADLGEIAELVPPDEVQSPEQKSPAVMAAEEALAKAEAELGDYLQAMQHARDAIGEAVVMVQEQRENFDYAHERFETLMPLVETGALEPLAASQIQSAYISARASLAQAKFLLGQARREFGTEDSRRRTHARLQREISTAQQDLERIRSAGVSSTTGNMELHDQTPAAIADSIPANGIIEAVFIVSPEEKNAIQKGVPAIVYSSAARETDMPGSATVQDTLGETALAGTNSVAIRVRLIPSAPPGWDASDRMALSCRIVLPLPRSLPAL
jgi:hypothetical protein